MKKKKINQNRIPISKDSFDTKQISLDATDGMVLRAWAVVLTGISGFRDVTTEYLLKFWSAVNHYQTSIDGYDGMVRELYFIREATGLTLPFNRIYSSEIRTQGDLKHYIRKVEENALSTAMAIVMEPIIRLNLLDHERLCIVAKKAADMNEEIAGGELSIADIQIMLQDEYNLILKHENGEAILERESL